MCILKIIRDEKDRTHLDMSIDEISICKVMLSLNCAIFSFISSPQYYSARYYVLIFSFAAQFLGEIFIVFQNTKANGTTMAKRGA